MSEVNSDVTLFQSTRPARGATDVGVYYGMDTVVSIHAPRAGRDLQIGR